MIFKKLFVHPKYPENLARLFQLAYNLWWTWDFKAMNLFYRIDPRLFREVNHNPVRFLLSLPREKIEALSNDKGFLFELEEVGQRFEEYLKYVTALEGENGRQYGFGQNDVIAYFLMEFGLHESIPIYGGGLGVLAGDFLKSASDMGVPVVGLGLLYKFGYFTQRVNINGEQEEVLLEFENHLIPIKELYAPNGELAHIIVKILGEEVEVKLWQVEVGKVRLILLDTDLEDNPPHLRDITDELYVADREKRIQQELVLGLGGGKAIDLLGLVPRVYHLNDGHCAFVIIWRLKKLMKEKGLSFPLARAIIRASTVFTTHTPVMAGNENFKTELAKKYLEPEIQELGLSFDQISDLGFVEKKSDVFWLPALAIRFSRYVNAVSPQHRQTSRKMWASLFPQKPLPEIPIDYVPNGVHISWISEQFSDIFNRYLGPDYRRYGQKEEIWKHIYDIPDEEIWKAHCREKDILSAFIRRELVDNAAAGGYSQAKILKRAQALNPEYLTIVFAKRFAHYKRATLILEDQERLKKILTHPQKPVQLIFAGKAHPADQSGKDMIKEIIHFARDYEVEDRVIFVENYDINIARHLVWGADVWLNTPAKDMEASGTSGMKAAMNGVLNLSVLEGWWREGFNGKNGWAITAGQFSGRSDLREVAEANQIYNLLEEDITELYYNRNKAGIPEKWVTMMKESMCAVCDKFNINTTLDTYLKKSYLPSIKESKKIQKSDYKLLKQAMAEEEELLKHWAAVEITHFATDIDKKNHISAGDAVNAECRVLLGQASPEIFSTELFYLYNNNRDFKIIPMQLKEKKNGEAHYTCSFEIEGYGLQNINARIRPANAVVKDLHPELIKWKD
ncbi:MAG: hypothetical protein AMS15_00140 [Planctomycetes bacterium DG_23]|nr:MAG: hypothetical protein AMS15_00140 [Planctomycetes bacterium DG_23]